MAIKGTAKRDTSIAQQLDFIGLGTANPDDCLELWGVIEKGLDSLLADFYAHLTPFAPRPMLMKINVPDLSERQKQHWKRLFTTFFSKEYVKSARKAGLAHDRLGLSADWYIGAYTFFQVRMGALVMDHYADDPATCHDRMALLTRLIGLDMAIVMSVYQED